MAGGDDGDLFAGREQTKTRTDPISGDDAIAPPDDFTGQAIFSRWVGDLTYDEVHAFIVGFAPWFLAAGTGGLLALAVALGITGAALGYARTPSRALGYLVREPHYVLGGAVLGWLFGASIMAAARLLAMILGAVL